jgi:hypothetical protein
MSVLKKMQFADTGRIDVADPTIIGAGVTECQNTVLFANGTRIVPCSIAAR